jgi:hypothetical protein
MTSRAYSSNIHISPEAALCGTQYTTVKPHAKPTTTQPTQTNTEKRFSTLLKPFGLETERSVEANLNV